MSLPFPHPKYYTLPSGEIYEVTSPILEEYDPESAYIDPVSPGPGRRVSEDREWGVWAAGDGIRSPGVVWPESRERTSIAREAKRAREMEGKEGVRRDKGGRET